MGFNFGLGRLVDGEIIRDETRIHAPDCDREDDGKFSCMCEFGFDCFRHSGDRGFFSEIATGGKIVEDEFVRPADFGRLRQVADNMNPEINRPRFHRLLDLLEADPNLYVASE